MIQSANILAELPRSPFGEHGRTFIADVYAVGVNKKRKRSELVAAIDGESVNLYDVSYESRATHIAKD